jgi:hypothetical protein
MTKQTIARDTNNAVASHAAVACYGYYFVSRRHLAPGEKPGGCDVTSGTRVHVLDYVTDFARPEAAVPLARAAADRVAAEYRVKYGNATVKFVLPRRQSRVSERAYEAIRLASGQYASAA